MGVGVFVSQSFSWDFDIISGSWSVRWEFPSPTKKKVSASSVFRGCTLQIFGMPYPIDLIPIPMVDVRVIVGMD